MACIIRSLIFQIGMWFFTILFSFFAICSFFLSPINRNKFIAIWAKSILVWLKITCNITFKVIGVKNIPNKPCVIFSKHQSAWETLALQEIFPAQVWVLKRELLWLPFFGWGLAMTSPIAIDRGSGKKALDQILKQGLDRIRKGFFVIIFPEGTRTKPTEKKKYHIGGAWLATQSKLDVIPVAHNAGFYWPKNSFIKKSGEIKVIIGQPIKSEGLKVNELNNKAEKWIEKTMLKLNV
jgi:1-acyl-sn-glycerol-3-phosphate acyltransferase